jgi:uncharacterized UPF0160 family protein
MQTIVTHSGSFDPDDVLAVASLQLYLGIDNVEIIRSREKNIINQANWAIDVGGYYNPVTHRYDHHQNGVPKRENGVPYSSFGLVWKDFGEAICGSNDIAKQIEKRLVYPIDAADNHMTVSLPNHLDLLPFEFFDIIDAFKPVWGSDETFDKEFLQAVEFGRWLLLRMIAHARGKTALQKMIENVYNRVDDKSILTFEEPIARHALVDYKEVKVVVSPVYANDVNHWMAVAIPQQDCSFENKVLFPEAWSGLANEELATISGIDGAIFCHKERYIFVAKTKQAALEASKQVE